MQTVNNYKNFETTEKYFNIAGSIPVVSIFSSALRITAGVVQAVAGAILAVIGYIGQMIHNNAEKWEKLSEQGLKHACHGGLNVIRGAGENLLGVTIIGSLIPLGIQLSSKNKFNPVIPYTEPPAVTAPAQVAV